jgi:hypothetical protein
MADVTELVGLPEGGPTSLPQVKQSLQITDSGDDDELGGIVAAVNNQVRTWAVSQAAVDSGEWPDRIVRGATMLAARLFRRKGSPAGVESFGSLGGAYVMRTDPDIAMLLKLGPWTGPQVG